MHLRRFVALPLFWLAACGGRTMGTGHGGTASCTTDSRVSAWAPNLEFVSATSDLKVRIVGADPSPPVKGSNRWTVRVTDAAGTDLVSPAIEVDSFMPDHGHGSPSAAVVTAAADGTWEVNPIHFFMPGVWRVTFVVTPVGGTRTSVQSFFCVEG